VVDQRNTIIFLVLINNVFFWLFTFYVFTFYVLLNISRVSTIIESSRA
jgi:hypothetical protein